MFRKTIASLVLACTAGLCAGAALQASLARGIASANIAERAETKNKLLKDRTAIIDDLIEIAKAPATFDKDDPTGRFNSKKLAIEILGRYRAAEAVDVLMANLSFRVQVISGTLGTFSSPGSYYPAAGSLVKIGTPSIEKVLSRIKMSDDPRERKLCTWVVREVEGKDVARKLLQDRLGGREHKNVKDRYEAALRLLDDDIWGIPQD